jgi:hypothetical protein
VLLGLREGLHEPARVALVLEPAELVSEVLDRVLGVMEVQFGRDRPDPRALLETRDLPGQFGELRLGALPR